MLYNSLYKFHGETQVTICFCSVYCCHLLENVFFDLDLKLLTFMQVHMWQYFEIVQRGHYNHCYLF